MLGCALQLRIVACLGEVDALRHFDRARPWRAIIGRLTPRVKDLTLHRTCLGSLPLRLVAPSTHPLAMPKLWRHRPPQIPSARVFVAVVWICRGSQGVCALSQILAGQLLGAPLRGSAMPSIFLPLPLACSVPSPLCGR